MSDPVSNAVYGRIPISLAVPFLTVLALLISVSEFRAVVCTVFWFSLRECSEYIFATVIFARLMASTNGALDLAGFLVADFRGILEQGVPFRKDVAAVLHALSSLMLGSPPIVAAESITSTAVMPAEEEAEVPLSGGDDHSLTSSTFSFIRSVNTVTPEQWLRAAVPLATVLVLSDLVIRSRFRRALRAFEDLERAREQATAGTRPQAVIQERMSRKIISDNLLEVNTWSAMWHWRWIYLVSDYWMASVTLDVLLRIGKMATIVLHAWRQDILFIDASVLTKNQTLDAILKRNDFLAGEYLQFVLTDLKEPEWLAARKLYGSIVVVLVVFAFYLWQRIFVFENRSSLPRYLKQGPAAAAYARFTTALRLHFSVAMGICAAALVLEASILVHLGVLAVVFLVSKTRHLVTTFS